MSPRRVTTSRRCCAAPPRRGRLVLTEEESKRFLTTYGIPVIDQRIVHSVEEALAAAKEVGYPVVLKVVSHEITHKNAAGGVELGLCSARRPRARLRRDARAREGARTGGDDRGRLGAEDGPQGRLRAHPRHEEGPAVRLGHRVRRGRRGRRGARGLLGEPAAAQPRARAAHDGGDAHLQVDEAPAARGRATRIWARSTSSSRCCPTSSSTSRRSPRST